MIKRTVEISRASYLHIAHQQLQIEQENKLVGSIPLEDLGVLLLAHPAIHLSHAVLYLAESHGAVIIVCNAQYIPVSLILPFSHNSLHTKLLRQQIAATLPTQKRIWQQIVQAKIKAQAQTLALAGENCQALLHLIGRVQSGDPENIEAQAAQLYWRSLLGDSFRRNREASDSNALLNYGYAILRAAVARSIVGAGLHPALGIHHHNQYDSLALADDLMEVLRPRIDRVVWRLQKENISILDANTKRELLELLAQPVNWQGQSLPLMVALHHYLASFKSSLFGESKHIECPQ